MRRTFRCFAPRCCGPNRSCFNSGADACAPCGVRNTFCQALQQCARQIVAHARDNAQLCTRHVRRKALAAFDIHQRIRIAVQHNCRRFDLAELRSAITIGNHCRKLARFDAAKQLSVTCPHCHTTWDQDDNHCRNLFHAHHQPVAEPAVAS